jgi:carbamate kinase
LMQNELAQKETPAMPMDVCGAMSQGQIGYLLQQQLSNELMKQGLGKEVVTLITRVEVDPADPSFQNPTKPVGSFYTEAEAVQFMREKKETWIEDSGRGWRKVVPSPQPRAIVEAKTVKKLVESSCLVIASGGGGIPVVTDGAGGYRGIEAVIDKDLAAEILAEMVDAEVLMILTDVPRVFLNYGRPEQQELREVSVNELAEYAAEGHFAAGSMGPKVKAVLKFARKPGRRAVITSLGDAVEALQGNGGTQVTAEGCVVSSVE